MRAPFLATALLAACSSSAAPRAPTAKAAPPAPAGPQVLDEGRLTIRIGGQNAGEETFKIVAAEGGGRTFTGQSTISLGGRKIAAESMLVTDAQYRPKSGTITITVGDKKNQATLLTDENGIFAMTTEGKEPVKEKERSALFIHDRFLSHLEPLCSLVGAEGRVLLVFPGVQMQVGPTVTREKDGRSYAHHAVSVGGGLPVDIICDGQKLVLVSQATSGLVASRAGYDGLAEKVEAARAKKPEIPAGVQEFEREVMTRDRVTLGCSLMLPADRRSPLPSVVLLTGSGAQDRDEDSPGGRPVGMAFYKHIAIALAQSGVASLRCDDRGVGKSKGTMAISTLESLAGDAISQVAQLRSEPALDPKRVGIVGHSEGGMVASIVAAGDGNIRALVLLASMGRTMDQLSLDQREDALRKAGMSQEDLDADRKRFTKIYAAIKAGKPLPPEATDEERKAIEPIIGYLTSHFRHDPVKTLKKIKVPVLIALGGKDFQVSEKEARFIAENLKKGGNKQLVEKRYPELSHLFAPSKTGTIEDYGDPELAVDPAFIGDVVTFLQRSL